MKYGVETWDYHGSKQYLDWGVIGRALEREDAIQLALQQTRPTRVFQDADDPSEIKLVRWIEEEPESRCSALFDNIFRCQREQGHEGKHTHVSQVDGAGVSWRGHE